MIPPAAVPENPLAFGARLALALRAGLVTAFRPARRPLVRPAWREARRLFAGGLLTLALIVIVTVYFDFWSVSRARDLPPGLIVAAAWVSEFGKSGWVLIPAAAVWLVLVGLQAWRPGVGGARQVLAAAAARVGFIFLAVGVPGLAVAVVKHLIGRSRPFVEGGADIYLYAPFGWNSAYASFPSGHTTTAFATLVAFTALWPRLFQVWWIFAILVGVSRVVVTAHHPSDVVAGAVFGAVGALLVRDWFAARGLVFTMNGQGAFRTMPGPSAGRIGAALRRVMAS